MFALGCNVFPNIFSFVSCILFSPILKTLFCVALLIAEKLNVLVTATILTFCGCGEYLKISFCTILRFFKFIFVVIRALIWMLPFYSSLLFCAISFCPSSCSSSRSSSSFITLVTDAI